MCAGEERGNGEEGENDEGDIVGHGSFVGDRLYWLWIFCYFQVLLLKCLVG